MAITNRQRIDKGLEYLREGLIPFVEQELKAALGPTWLVKIQPGFDRPLKESGGIVSWDTYALLKVMWDQWNTAFGGTLSREHRSYVSELQLVRNTHAHEGKFSSDDTERALDTMRRMLEAVSSPAGAEAVLALRKELIRVQQAEEARLETRKAMILNGNPLAGLKPWREVIQPHPDVARGDYQQAEFAADLGKVHRGEASDEYGKPREFFERTFLTEGLKDLLSIGLKRLTGKRGDPVLELKTNFGGGKTHSMLALYHLFGGGKASDLPGMEDLLRELNIEKVPEARRAVLVGTAFAPGQARRKADGTVINTLWGELAYQLGGASGYAMVKDSDIGGTSPGSDLLGDLLKKFSPCLVLIDEWVAFLRQLPGKDNLPAGSYDSNLSFAQSLTEAVKVAPRALIVASLPVSDIEIGGTNGEKALESLSNVFKRVAKPWKPASTEEGFEIVRRRLFSRTMDYAARDAVVKAFSEMYREQQGEFPSECREADYRRKLEASYPIHPELFDRLDKGWSALDKFQRTRGVLRLMAAVIHELWRRDDRNLVILPASITLDAGAVRSLITECLPDGPQWESVIGKDVDGPHALPAEIDSEPNLGRYSACRRVARTLFMGSAPTYGLNNPGIDDKTIRLGCSQPGETVATFGDALRRLSDRATHMYVDQGRYWYSLSPTVTRLAKDRAEQLKGSVEVSQEIIRRLRLERLPTTGKNADEQAFCGVHAVPESSSDVSDETSVRLVVLGPGDEHTKKKVDSPALLKVADILYHRGNSPRIYRNSLVFLAPDSAKTKDLDDSIRQYLAWKSIRDEAENEILDISKFAKGQAKSKTDDADRTCGLLLSHTWAWVLVPKQPDPLKPEIEYEEITLPGGDSLVGKVSKKLTNAESIFPALGAPRLKLELDRYLWKNADHVSLKHIAECCATYLYLPRLKNRDVLKLAVQNAFGSLLCEQFAYASSWDEKAGRYIGLQTDRLTGPIEFDGLSLLVKPEVAIRQIEKDEASKIILKGSGIEETSRTQPDTPNPAGTSGTKEPAPEPTKPKRYHGTVVLDTTRTGRDAGKIADEIIAHLAGLMGAEVKVTLEIEAQVPNGIPDSVVRVVTENGRVLKFTSQGFEKD